MAPRKRRCMHVVSRCAAIAGMIFGIHAASADCESPGWLPGDKPAGAGVNSEYPHVCTEWDPDGVGSLPSRLVVAGSFSIAGGRMANSIAYWDGTDWYPMGDGLNDFDSVVVAALCVHNGELYAAGHFLFSDSTYLYNIARWDGTSWQPLAEGTDGSVTELISFDGNLIACGEFGSAGTTYASRIARWDGATWHPMGDGFDESATSLAIVNGELYASGFMTSSGSTTLHGIARWTGSAWVDVGGGTDDTIYSISAHNGKLVAVGIFEHAGLVSAENVAMWDGSAWHAMGAGLPLPMADAAVIGSDLVVVSRWYELDNLSLPNAYRWNGAAWTPLPLVNGAPRSVTSFRDEIAIAGLLHADTSGERAGGVLTFDGVEWQIAGQEGLSHREVRVIDTYQGEVIIAMRQNRRNEPTPDEEPDFGLQVPLVRWDNGSIIDTLGVFSTHNGTPSVTATAEYNSNLYACGKFSYVDSTPAINIAKWNGSSWSALGDGIGPAGMTLQSMAIYNGELYAGGEFAEDDGSPGNSITRWDGTQWHPLGSGLSYQSESFTTVGNVNAMMPYQSQLLVVGRFTHAGGVVATNIALWNGSSWSAFPSNLGIPGAAITACGYYNEQLVVAWYAIHPGTSAKSAGVSVWNGSSWSNLSTGFTRPNNNLAYLSKIVDTEGDLYVTGYFSSIDEVSANNIARWDGSTWSPLGGGLERINHDIGTGVEVWAMLFHDGELLVGGTFDKADGQGSPNFARYCLGLPAPCAADFNNVNGVTVQDIFDFLTAWLAGNASADFNHVNGVTVQDIFDFLTAWLAGC